MLISKEFKLENNNCAVDPLATEKSLCGLFVFNSLWAIFSKFTSKSLLIFIMKINYNQQQGDVKMKTILHTDPSDSIQEILLEA